MNADAYTGGFFVYYCTNCKYKGATCEGDGCEGRGKLDYYEEDEEADEVISLLHAVRYVLRCKR